MADIKLVKPQAGERVSIQSAADARLEFAFSTTDAVLEKSGNDLVFTFSDGSSIVLTEFYTAYTKESLPEFVVEGQTIAGSEFFAALGNDDLMPAAGPAATRAADGARFREYDESALMDGIDRLDGLDLPWAQQAFQDDFLATGPGFIDPGADTGSNSVSSESNLPPVVGPAPEGQQVVEAGVKKGGDEAEDGVSTVTGKIDAVDPEGDALNFYLIDADGNKVDSITTEYGTITIDSEGNYTYTLNNDGAANGLGADDSKNEKFTVGVSDGSGNTSTVDVNIDIQGTNDRPELTMDNGAVVEHKLTEDVGTNTITGTFETTDVDSDGAHQDYTITGGTDTTGTAVTGHDREGDNADTPATFETAYGTLTLNMDGTYSYVLTEGGAAQNLGDGDSHTEKFIITVTDKHGATSKQEISIDIKGTNDVPTLSADKVALVVTESGVLDGGNSITGGVDRDGGNLTANDVDTNDTLIYTVNGEKGTVGTPVEGGKIELDSPYGKFVLDPATGKYTYELDNDASNSLASGEEREETFTVTVSDGKGGTTTQDVTVTIKGTNDKPTLTITNKELNVTEDGSVSGSADNTGTAKGDDVDNNADLSYSFGIDADGNPITETGDGDGKFTIDPNTGEYTYTLDSTSDAVQSLGEGEKITKTFTIRVQDEHGAWTTQEVTVVINGTNDAPTVSADKVALVVTESGVLDGGNSITGGVDRDGGNLTANDVDTNDTLTYTVNGEKGTVGTPVEGGKIELDSPYGKFVLDPATGEYTYELDNDASNSLASGEEREETFTVTVSDGKGGTTTQDVTVTIKGTNDKPELTIDGGVPVDHKIVEDTGSQSIDGTFVVTDVDSDTGTNQTFTVAGGDGTVIIKEQEGHNVAGDGDTSAVYETAYGTLTLNMDGTYTYTLTEGGAAQNLGEGKTHTEKFTITVTDEHGATSEKEIEIEITGTNDAPVLTPQDITLNMKEDGVKDSEDWGKDANGKIIQNEGERGKMSSGGKLEISDADAGDTFQFSVTYIGSDGKVHEAPLVGGKYLTEHGAISINQDGTYTYTVNNAHANPLKQGEILNDDFTIHVKDSSGAANSGAEHSQDVKVEIEGTNDKPTLKLDGSDSASIKYTLNVGKNESIEKTAATGDVDNDFINTVSITGKGGTTGTAVDGKNMAGTAQDSEASFTTDYGKFTLDPATGKFNYKLDPDSEFVRALGAGVKHTETFTIRVQDEHGAWVEKEVNIIITGQNDAPEVTVTSLDLTIQEDNGTIGVAKPDNLTQTGKVVAHDDDRDASGKGDKLRYDLVDDKGQTRALIKGEGGVDQDGNPVTGDYGYLTLDPNTGEYTYTLFNDSDLVQSMGAGETVTQTFTVRVSDGKGGFTEKEITITIKGTDDTPTISGEQAGVVEDGGVLARPDLPGEKPTNPTTGGKLEIADVDKNDEKSFELVGGKPAMDADGNPIVDANGDPSMTIEGKYGTLTLNPDGSYTYELTYTGDDLQAKNAGEWFADEKFDVIWQSGTDGGNKVTITIDIKGSNDKPLLNVQEGNKDEVVTSDVTHENGTETGKVTAGDIDDTGDKDLTFSIMNQYDSNGNPVAGGDFTDTTGKETAPGAGDNHWQPEQTGNGLYGSLTINPDGTYTYTLDIFDQDALDAYFAANPNADSITEKFTVTVTDPHGATDTKVIEVSVPRDQVPGQPGHGEGSKPEPDHTLTVEVEPGTPHMVKEDGTLVAKGKVDIKVSCDSEGQGHDGDHKGEFMFGFKDADGNFITTVSDKYGSITINPVTGEYTYTLNNDSKYVQEMNEGETWQPELPPVYVVSGPDANGNWKPATDANGKPVEGTIDITIEGTNDAPTISSVDKLEAKEGDGSVTLEGSVKAHDVDSGGANGDDLSYRFFDQNGNAIGEGGIDTPYGKLTVNADGSYSFAVDSSNTQSLGVGQNGKYTFTVEVSDEHGGSTTKEIEVNIKGENDAPVFTVEGKDLEFTEDGIGKPILTGKVEATDVDNGDNAGLRYSMSDGSQSSSHILSSPYGTMILNPKTGEYEFHLDGNSDPVQALGAGETAEVTYTITVDDGHGGKNSQDVTVTIKGTNDEAKVDVNAVTTKTVIEAAEGKENVDVVRGQITITDKDANDTHTLTIKSASGKEDTVLYKAGEEAAQVDGKYGILTMNADGTYSYKLTSDALGAGEKYGETFTIYVKEYDSFGNVLKTTEQKITVDLVGTNDKPVVVEESSDLHSELIVTNDGIADIVKGKLDVTDEDVTDKHIFSANDGKEHHGTLTFDAEGNYTYTLNEGYTPPAGGVEDTFTVTIDDGKGGKIEQEVTIGIKPEATPEPTSDSTPEPIADVILDQTPDQTADQDADQDTEAQSAGFGLFMPEGDEDLFLGNPLENATPLVQGADHYGIENESATDMLAADLFPRGQEENMDSLLDTLSQGSNEVASADLPAPDAAAEVPNAEFMDVAASLPQVDAMAEATALAANKIVLENNG